jgi:NAD(P)-dependent dehydrogenase (short-subunit alcohol dehydrogenase family)
MATLSIQESDIPSLDGLVAVVTGGSSGIGLGAVHILLERGAHVVNLDLAPPTADIPFSSRLSYIETDISSWSSLVHAFAIVADQHASLDIAIANAGLGGDTRYLENCLKLAPKSTEDWKALAQEEDEMESMWKTAGVNLKGTSNFIMLAARMMKRSNAGGSIVVTTSATAYIPEHSIPLYCATKAAVSNPYQNFLA